MLRLHRKRAPRAPLLALGAAGAASLGGCWYLDASRRARKSALLHRTMVEVLLNALSAGDAFTEDHCRRVADLTDSFARVCRMDRKRRATLRVASLLHDMGKIDEEFFDIVHSTERLSPEERARIKKHPHESAHILRPLEPFHPGLPFIVESHHERWDGEGYPRGLHGEEIPIEARIISVADVFDALTQARSYKKPRSVESALSEIRHGAGHRFDPGIVAQLDRPSVLSEWRSIAEKTGKREQGTGNREEGRGKR